MRKQVFQTSEQTRQIRNMMAARKRALGLSSHKVTYPQWVPGMTTREYVERFNLANANGLVNPLRVPDTPAPFLTSDVVLVEEVTEHTPQPMVQPELMAA